MKEAYYRPSGKFSPTFFLFFILMHLFAIPILSFAYIYSIHYIPYLYFNFLIVIFCGFAAGFIMRMLISFYKVRNLTIAIIFGLIAICVLKYVQWCIYVPLVFSKVYGIYDLTIMEQLEFSLTLFLHPASLLEYVKFINQEGVWSLSSSSHSSSASLITGLPLTIVWVGEFILMCLFSLIAFIEKVKTPFSEDENEWYQPLREKVYTRVPEDYNNLKCNIEHGDFNELIQLSNEYDENALQFLNLNFYKAKYSESYYLKIIKVMLPKNKKKDKIKNKTWITYVAIDRDSVNKLLNKEFN